MMRTVICAPMAIERLALRRASTPVARTGMGPARSGRAIFPGRAVLVAGVAGGLATEVNVGDVVVATSVLGPDGASAGCQATSLLASELRRLGLTVHIGPIRSEARVVSGSARRKLDGLAVDTESFWLAPTGGEPFAVVRVISDTDAQPLLRPGIVPHGIRALAHLRRCVPALDAWAAALVDPLKIRTKEMS
jgi:4-hydroxy-3-methylbut-2-en-1-yl diphosphate reductase